MISGIDYGKGNDGSCTITFVSPEYIKELEEENKKLQQRIDKAIPMLDELEKKIQEIFSCKIPITEIKQIKEILNGGNNE